MNSDYFALLFPLGLVEGSGAVADGPTLDACAGPGPSRRPDGPERLTERLPRLALVLRDCPCLR
jgi:hypothetical protein